MNPHIDLTEDQPDRLPVWNGRQVRAERGRAVAPDAMHRHGPEIMRRDARHGAVGRAMAVAEEMKGRAGSDLPRLDTRAASP